MTRRTSVTSHQSLSLRSRPTLRETTLLKVKTSKLVAAASPTNSADGETGVLSVRAPRSQSSVASRSKRQRLTQRPKTTTTSKRTADVATVNPEMPPKPKVARPVLKPRSLRSARKSRESRESQESLVVKTTKKRVVKTTKMGSSADASPAHLATKTPPTRIRTSNATNSLVSSVPHGKTVTATTRSPDLLGSSEPTTMTPTRAPPTPVATTSALNAAVVATTAATEAVTVAEASVLTTATVHLVMETTKSHAATTSRPVVARAKTSSPSPTVASLRSDQPSFLLYELAMSC